MLDPFFERAGTPDVAGACDDVNDGEWASERYAFAAMLPDAASLPSSANRKPSRHRALLERRMHSVMRNSFDLSARGVQPRDELRDDPELHGDKEDGESATRATVFPKPCRRHSTRSVSFAHPEVSSVAGRNAQEELLDEVPPRVQADRVGNPIDDADASGSPASHQAWGGEPAPTSVRSRPLPSLLKQSRMREMQRST